MAYTFSKYSDAVLVPAGNADNIEITDDGLIAVITSATTPFLLSYALDKDAKTMTRKALPATTLTGAPTGLRVHPNGEVVYACIGGAGGLPRLQIFTIGMDGVLVKQANPAIPNVTSSYPRMRWGLANGGTLLLNGLNATIIRFSVSGVGLTKLTDQDVGDRPTGNVRGFDYSEEDKLIAVVHQNSPFLTMYRVNLDNSLTKLPGPAVPLTKQAEHVSINPINKTILCAYGSAPQVTIHSYDTDGNATLVETVTTASGGTINSARWHPSGAFYVMGCSAVPRALFYDYKNGVSTVFTPDVTLPAGSVWETGFTPDGTMMVMAARDTNKIYTYDVIAPPPTAGIQLGENDIQRVALGDTVFDAVYIGATQIN